jgi:hypothetical protein
MARAEFLILHHQCGAPNLAGIGISRHGCAEMQALGRLTKTSISATTTLDLVLHTEHRQGYTLKS